MLDPIGGLTSTSASANRARPTDWSFLALLAQATQQYATRNVSFPSESPTAIGALSRTPTPSTAAAASTPLQRADVNTGDQSGAVAPTPAAPSPAPPAAATTVNPFPPNGTGSGTLTLGQYPRPPGDTGRGFDWIPTLGSTPDVVDNFVQKARALGASWVTLLNDGSNVGQNDYLVKSLVANHIEPVMRIYTSHGSPIDGNLTGMVQHYVDLGVHYFLPYNEPNLPDENPNGIVSVDSYVDKWIGAARSIVAGGGMPGIGGLAPAAPVDDVKFLQQTLNGVRQRGATDLLNQGWISVHNYTFNRPVDYTADSNGFLKFRWYDHVAQQELGRSLPVISTEGGPRMGASLDPRYPTVDETRRDQLATATIDYLPNREPYFFAQTEWLLANEAGGGHDPAWSADALFKADGSPSPLAVDLQQSESQV